MTIEDYKLTIQSKIEDCAPKIDYYKSYTDNVMSAYWKGRKEAHEEDLKMLGEIDTEEPKEIKGRRSKT